ncbi:Sporulation-specific N-acetylmuramoyl-L-alanine amidase [compost metagenome]
MSEEFGLEVNWDNRTKTVYLTSDEAADSEDSPESQEELKPGVGTNAGTATGTATGAGTGTGSDTASTQVNRKIEDIHFTDNRLTITMDQTVQPKAFAMSQPDRIVLDLPGTALSDSFSVKNRVDTGVSQIEFEAEEHSLVNKVRYSLFDSKSSTIRIVLDLSGQADYRLSTGESIIVLELSEKTAAGAANSDNARKVVVIDAGHGDQDNGTTGVSGKVEKDFNLTMALKVEELLKQEPLIDVVLTRHDDTYVTRPDRAKLANDLNADAFISIHANSVLNIPTANGTETYYFSEASKPLADVMHKHLIEATQLKDRKVKYNNYEVLRRSNMPAALLEVGFLSNAEEEALLFTENFQNRVAQGIVDGIKEYFGIVS